MRRDVKWDFEVPYHNNYFAGGAIHHNSGKTICIWKKVNDLATGVHPTLNKRFPVPIDIRVIAPKYEDNVRDVLLEMFRKNVRRIDLQGGTWAKAWSEKHRTLTYANGSRVRFFSLDQDVDTMGGKSAHIVWFDEHAPYKYFIENVMRLVDNNGMLFYTMTPEKGITWEKDYIVDGSLNNKHVKYWQFATRKNPHLNQTGVEVATSLIKDKNLMAAKMDGGFVPLTGRVYENFSRVRNVFEVDRLPKAWGGELPGHWYRDFLLDPHKQKPHYMCIVAWSPEEEVFIESESNFASPDGVNQLKDHIRMMCIGKKITRFIMDESLGGNSVDNFGQASMKSQLKSLSKNEDGSDNLGIPFLGTNQESDKSWQAGYMLLSQYVNPNPISGKPRFYLLDSCPIAIRQFENYCWMDDAMDEKPLREKAKQIDNEAPDLARYAVMGRPKIFGEKPSAKKIMRPGTRDRNPITGMAR